MEGGVIFTVEDRVISEVRWSYIREKLELYIKQNYI